MSRKKMKNRVLSKKFAKLFLTYFMLFVVLFGIVDYYAYMVFNFLYFIAISALIAVPVTWVHIKNGKKGHVDDVSDEIF